MRRSNKRGQVTLYIMFIIAAIVIVLIAAVFAPMGVLFNAEMYKAGEDIMLRANNSISGIKDDAVRERVQAVIAEGLSDQEQNIEINSDIFQYSWIVVLVLAGLILFLYTRQMVEFSRFGGGGFV